MLRDHPGALARTKDTFQFRHGVSGVLILDYDPIPGKALTKSQLWTLLQSVAPGVADGGALHWVSGSSCISDGDVELRGVCGQRFYVLVQDASDIPRTGTVLRDRLWLAGLGRVAISTSGAKLMRHIFDDAMNEPARLDFAGGAICSPPLSQRRGVPEVLSDGGFIDTRIAFPDLSATEAAKVEGLQNSARDDAEVEAAAIREAWTVARGATITAALVRVGVAPAEARERGAQAARSAQGGVLLGDYSVTLDDGHEVSIGQILDDRDRYHGRMTRDPVEPDYLNGKVTGKLYLFGAVPNLYSFAHGGCTYRLHRQPARIFLATGRRAETCDELRTRLANEHDIFIKGGIVVRLAAGRLQAITKPAQLSYMIGTRFALFRKGKDGADVAADLDDATANMLLASIGGAI
jgi:hypothetical protein